MESYKPTYIIDISNRNLNENIKIIGYVINKHKSTDHLSIRIQDFTGSIVATVLKELGTNRTKWSEEYFWVGARLEILGSVSSDKNDNPIVNKIIEIKYLGNINPNTTNLGGELKEQVSRMLMSRICKNATNFLEKNNFTQFESRLISSFWIDEGLEPLKVLYPGFGSPATLITSPSSQVMDFLSTTLASRAFTNSYSFTSTYRLPNGAAESRIIVAKATDLDLKNHQKMLWDITYKMLGELIEIKKNIVEEVETPNIIYGDWSNGIPVLENDSGILEKELNIINYCADLTVIRDNWKTKIDTIIQIIHKNKIILVEGAREVLGEERVISSICIYPSRFLSLIEKAPARQLKELWRFKDFDK